MRRTKIVATVGPSSTSPEVLGALIDAGANVFRLNFSHGTHEEHRQRAETIRQLATEKGVSVGLLGDLQGPKIRLRNLPCDSIALKKGQAVCLDTDLDDGEGNENHVGVGYEPLPQSVNEGDILLLDDGLFRFKVLRVEGNKVYCVSESSGTLKSRKGINRLGGGLSAPALTEKDLEDIHCAAAIGLDYVAVSFPSNAGDIHYAREKLEAAGCFAQIVSKIERAEAVADNETLDAIILASDAVMVARGDLGVEIGDAHLIGLQKDLIKRSRMLNRVVITATQMMESMIASPIPTRAEVFDVANAVLDGTDAVMLSAETAAGEYPIDTVEAMARTCVGAEQYPKIRQSGYRLDRKFDSVGETIAMSAMYAANQLTGVKGLVALTETGRSALLMSRLSSGLPIYAMSRHASTCNKVALYRGVQPVQFAFVDNETDLLDHAIAELRSRRYLATGDTVIVTFGEIGVHGKTNTMKIITLS